MVQVRMLRGEGLQESRLMRLKKARHHVLANGLLLVGHFKDTLPHISPPPKERTATGFGYTCTGLHGSHHGMLPLVCMARQLEILRFF